MQPFYKKSRLFGQKNRLFPNFFEKKSRSGPKSGKTDLVGDTVKSENAFTAKQINKAMGKL